MTQPKTYFMAVLKASVLKSVTYLVILVLVSMLSESSFAESTLKEDAVAYRMLGYEAQNKGVLSEALKYYQKAVGIDPTYACAYNDMGILYEMLGQPSSAEDAYLKTITIDPGYINAYTNLALLYEREGQYRAAARCWIRRAYSGSPYDPWTRRAQDRINELSRVIPELKEFYIPRELSSGNPNEKSAIMGFFGNSNDFFDDKLSGKAYAQ